MSPRLSALLPPPFLLPALVSGIWGCLLARLWVSGDLINLQSPRFHSLTLLAAGACLLIALLAPLLFQPPRQKLPVSRFLKLLGQSVVLLLPPLAYLIQGPTFSTPTALLDRAWIAANARHSSSLPRRSRPDPVALARRLAETDPAAPVPVSMVELLTIEADPALRAAFAERSIELLGQFLPDSPDQFRLVRLLMVCCAADARPLGLVVYGKAPDLAPGNWATTVGHLIFDDSKERVVLRARHTTPTEAPPDLFLY
ncbi:MAG: hypothetical protein OHK005_13680 [Candidatus Methylacidiphilales bacterium]